MILISLPVEKNGYSPSGSVPSPSHLTSWTQFGTIKCTSRGFRVVQQNRAMLVYREAKLTCVTFSFRAVVTTSVYYIAVIWPIELSMVHKYDIKL
jgi:hypothetical protein